MKIFSRGYLAAILTLLTSASTAKTSVATTPSSNTNTGTGIGTPESIISDKLWHELGRGIGNENLSDLAGYSIATSASGYTVAIGSPLHTSLTETNAPKRAGRVRVYRYNSSRDGWTKLGQDITGQEIGDEFGRSVHLNDDGDVLAVGAPNCERRGLKEVGCVNVYELTLMVGPEDEDRDVWFQVGVTITGEASLEHFGMDVHIEEVYDSESDIDSYQLAAGAPGARTDGKTIGKVYFYNFEWDLKRQSLDWTPKGFIVPKEPGTDNQALDAKFTYSDFGSSISMTGDSEMILVGAPRYGDYEEGAAILYKHVQGTLTWLEIASFVVDNPTLSYDYKCGTSVSIDWSGKYLAYGCPGASSQSGSLLQVGKVETYMEMDDPDGSQAWEKKQALYGEEEGDLSGTSIQLSKLNDGHIFLAIGAPKNSPTKNDLVVEDAGHVRVYYGRTGVSYWERAGLDVDGTAADDRYGSSVAISSQGHIVAAGAPDGGYAKIFQLAFTAPPTPGPTMAPHGNGGGGDNLDKDFSRKSASVWFVFFISIFAIGVIFALFLVGKKMRERGSTTGFSNVNTQDDGGLRGTEMVANPGVVSTAGESRDII